MPYKHVTVTVLVDGVPREVERSIPKVWCTPCWKASGYRDEGPGGFDPLDAGEAYDEDDY